MSALTTQSFHAAISLILTPEDREKKKRLNESGACLGEEKVFHF
jgi:hypothetical protein